MIEYNPNINFKIWRVYPPDSDNLDLDHKDWQKGRAEKRAFTFLWDSREDGRETPVLPWVSRDDQGI
jgi:hypothetical protein